jgi:hypothetical protein
MIIKTGRCQLGNLDGRQQRDTNRRSLGADWNFWDRRFNRVKVKVIEELAIYLLVYGTLPGGATSYGISVR